jgi:UDP-glucose 4-epimerase
MVSALQELIDKPLTVIDGGRRDGDPARLVADISRIRREVGWQPKTELREGLLRTVDFYESHRHLWERPSLRDRPAA